jgi:hypothetical protein
VSDPEEILNDLVAKGGLEFVGVDTSSGEAMYRPTPKLKDIDPTLSKDMSLYFSEISMRLWANGFINMDITLANPMVTLAEKSFDIRQIDLLDKEERHVLEQMIKTLSSQK